MACVVLSTLASFGIALHFTLTFLRCILGFMAVRLPFVVAALCATSGGVYAEGEGLVATVAGNMEAPRQGRPSQGPPPPGKPSEGILSHRALLALRCARALCFGPSLRLHDNAGVLCICVVA